jgi:hypothetical protein
MYQYCLLALPLGTLANIARFLNFIVSLLMLEHQNYFIYGLTLLVPVLYQYIGIHLGIFMVRSFQRCGSGMFIPDPYFFHPGSEFFPSRIHIKEFKYFIPKNCFQALGNMIRVGLFMDFGSRGQKGTGSRIRIQNTGSLDFVLD